jgi:hypothetical protein
MRKVALVNLLLFIVFYADGLPCAPVYSEESSTTIIAAGDIGDCKLPGANLTATLIENMEGDVLAVGDLVYPEGAPKDYIKCYEPTWGRFKARTLPVPGNHDYGTRDAAGYFGYFGAQAGDAGKGYYSVDRPGWHIVALNSNIDSSENSEQMAWLQHDLANTQLACILAFWHHPRFSSGPHGNNNHMAPIWETLSQHHASIVISGHDHDYERLAPMDTTGRIDVMHGIRSFVVGTGGARLYNFGMRSFNSEAWSGNSWGVLKLTLFPGRYRWEFIPVEGGNYQDSGEGRCVAE